MGFYILIAFIVSIAWLVKDVITLGHTFDISKQWAKYVGALLAGVLFVFLKGWDVFQYILVVAVVSLVAQFFSDVLKFIMWIRSLFSHKK